VFGGRAVAMACDAVYAEEKFSGDGEGEGCLYKRALRVCGWSEKMEDVKCNCAAHVHTPMLGS